MARRYKLVATETPDESDARRLASTIREKLLYTFGKTVEDARPHDWFVATALAVRDRVIDRWIESAEAARGRKQVNYLSIEYLLGRLLGDALSNMRLSHQIAAALDTFGVDIDALRPLEFDAALGNGGLGRLAACFMESMATLRIPAYGYGVRYDYGLFRQQIRDGWQTEVPDDWLSQGNPWEIERQDVTYPVRFGGAVEYLGGDHETAPAVWYPAEAVNAVAFDMPIVGWGGAHINTLRLWSARATEPLHLYAFNRGDHVGALADRARAEALSRILYPSADTAAGQELRLRQEYFFTSASLQDLVQRHVVEHGNIGSLPDHASIQMNDTHPALAVAELMRILVDVQCVSWPEAWRITTSVLNYTNHTLLPEAIETWPVDLMNRLLPRHMQIIYLINWLHLKKVTASHDISLERLADISLIQEGDTRNVRMGHLAYVGSAKVNGVSALHTELMRRTVFRALDEVYPGRINNKTNGIAFRRWLFQANPALTRLLVDAAGERICDDPDALRGIEPLAGDRSFVERFAQARRDNKTALSVLIRAQTGLAVDPDAMFDVHIKRIHEYKRQLLNLLETIALYQSIRDRPNGDWVPRVKVFAGKAAATYFNAKLIIKLANDVARVVNADPVVSEFLKVVFLPNYGVTLAEAIIPAADLSEQISTAGLEASGTGNMKLALNGALTIGTLDGANVEIRQHVGADNVMIFGLTVDGVAAKRAAGFTGREAASQSALFTEALASLAGGLFSPSEPDRFQHLTEKVLGCDEFMTAADFDAYWETQRGADKLWRDQPAWWRKSVLNTARMGWSSSDRAIREYAADIWHVPAGDEAAAGR